MPVYEIRTKGKTHTIEAVQLRISEQAFLFSTIDERILAIFPLHAVRSVIMVEPQA